MASRVAPARTSAGIVIVFGLSRLGAYAAGMRFDPSPLVTFWHFPDRALLRGHLFQTLFYMHDQPPLFGLVVGTVLKFFPHAFATVMHGIYIALGLIATLALYALLRQFGFSDRGSALVAVGFTLLPATMVYEQWLFYEYPTMTLLLAAFAAVALSARLEKFAGRRDSRSSR